MNGDASEPCTLGPELNDDVIIGRFAGSYSAVYPELRANGFFPFDGSWGTAGATCWPVKSAVYAA